MQDDAPCTRKYYAARTIMQDELPCMLVCGVVVCRRGTCYSLVHCSVVCYSLQLSFMAR
ncbi:hypothetical protein HMPREF3190_00666 [Umbribacter vaginalis]|nr:hypothetical protein HMPREF3190_00666 [Coriobacteriales bacterium DNF00809]